jgi:transposase-like protein
MGHRYDDEAAPLCPLCGMAMVLVRVDPRVAAFSELHTYRCFSCGDVRAVELQKTDYAPAAAPLPAAPSSMNFRSR